ncbi:MAG: DNA mismatch endonuclease Vsr [Porphyromonadaceae bacterium]|jgi:DNA mismatch endonuclease (patch repair protein)|nr:DNA mismatch endonuclease Vsr [Porphyromonadaceae bacterium]
MADVHDKATRSYNMSRIKGTDTKPEMLLRKYLHAHGIRYRLHNKNLPGKPDLTLAKYHTVIFVNGCFWHGHKGCKYFVLPKTRTEWWRDKIEETIKRDIKAMKDLKESGWNSTVIWECELKPEKRNTTLENLYHLITKVEELNYAQ